MLQSVTLLLRLKTKQISQILLDYENSCDCSVYSSLRVSECSQMGRFYSGTFPLNDCQHEVWMNLF